VTSFELIAPVTHSLECHGIRFVHGYNFPKNFYWRKPYGKQKTITDRTFTKDNSCNGSAILKTAVTALCGQRAHTDYHVNLCPPGYVHTLTVQIEIKKGLK
jgi:hypothetical protein